MCISSIVWSGFKKVFYLFPYLTTSKQGIPHDIDIMHELWGVPSYQRQNKVRQGTPGSSPTLRAGGDPMWR